MSAGQRRLGDVAGMAYGGGQHLCLKAVKIFMRATAFLSWTGAGQQPRSDSGPVRPLGIAVEDFAEATRFRGL